MHPTIPEIEERLRLVGRSWGYELSKLDTIDMADYVTQVASPEEQLSQEVIEYVLHFYGYDPLEAVTN